MNTRERIGVYVFGFVLGSLLVSAVLMRRAAREETSADPWQDHSRAAAVAGAEPLPRAVPAALLSGAVVDYGQLPGGGTAWVLTFDESYPFVRVERDAAGEMHYMAADQVVVKLAEGVDVTALNPVLDALGLRLRMFSRRERAAVVGVLDTRLDAVPRTVQALNERLGASGEARPDMIVFR